MNPYMQDHYSIDSSGNFETLSSFHDAISNGDVSELSNGNYYDRSTGTEYDSRGDVVESRDYSDD